MLLQYTLKRRKNILRPNNKSKKISILRVNKAKNELKLRRKNVRRLLRKSRNVPKEF